MEKMKKSRNAQCNTISPLKENKKKHAFIEPECWTLTKEQTTRTDTSEISFLRVVAGCRIIQRDPATLAMNCG